MTLSSNGFTAMTWHQSPYPVPPFLPSDIHGPPPVTDGPRPPLRLTNTSWSNFTATVRLASVPWPPTATLIIVPTGAFAELHGNAVCQVLPESLDFNSPANRCAR